MTVGKELSYLALAIVQAGAYISSSQCSLTRYLEMYREHRGRLLEEYRDHAQKIDDYEQTVYTTWAISFTRLSPHATTFLHFCAFLHHSGISEAIFEKAVINVGTYVPAFPPDNQELDDLQLAKDFLSMFQTTDSVWDIQKFLKVIIEICSYSLMDFNEGNKTYSIHPLVHAWMLTTFSDATMSCACVQWVLGITVNWEFKTEDYRFRRMLLPHIEAALQREAAPISAVAQLQLVYVEAGSWRKAEELQVQLMQKSKQLLGDEHPESLITMGYLAATYREQGHWKEAEMLQVQVMEKTKQLLGDKHPDTLNCMANLAATHWKQGQWKEAEMLQVQVTEKTKQLLGDKHPDTLNCMANLAVSHWNQGQLEEAEVLQVQVVEKTKQLLGDEHPGTLKSMANLAATYWKQGQWKEAEVLQVQVMEKTKQLLGDEHPDTLNNMANLVATYWSQGQWKKAEVLQVQVMEKRKLLLGDEHPSSCDI